MSEDKFSFAKALELVLSFEGGYVNDPKDPGGATNFGITQRTYNTWRLKAGKSVENIKTIKQTEVASIYYDNYWLSAKCPQMPERVAVAVFDSAVNCGVAQAVKFLQKAVFVKVDGKIGPETIDTVNHLPEFATFTLLMGYRKRFYENICKNKPSQKKFLNGWLNRLDRLKDYLT